MTETNFRNSRDNLTLPRFVTVVETMPNSTVAAILVLSCGNPAETAYCVSQILTQCAHLHAHLHPYTRPVTIGRDQLAVREDPISDPARQRAPCDRDVVIGVGSKRQVLASALIILRSS